MTDLSFRNGKIWKTLPLKNWDNITNTWQSTRWITHFASEVLFQLSLRNWSVNCRKEPGLKRQVQGCRTPKPPYPTETCSSTLLLLIRVSSWLFLTWPSPQTPFSISIEDVWGTFLIHGKLILSPLVWRAPLPAWIFYDCRQLPHCDDSKMTLILAAVAKCW